MATISIIEFLVYAFMCYFPLSLLLVSILKKPVASKEGTWIRLGVMILGVLGAFVMVGAGPTITVDNIVSTVETYDNQTSTLLFTQYSDTSNEFVLQQEVWIPIHVAMGFIMAIYIISEALFLFGRYAD